MVSVDVKHRVYLLISHDSGKIKAILVKIRNKHKFRTTENIGFWEGGGSGRDIKENGWGRGVIPCDRSEH